MFKKLFFLIILLVLCKNNYSQFNNLQLPIKVSSNGRYFEYKNGKPFLWVADTGWELIHSLDKNEVDFYLETRAKQGFNVIQIVALPEL